MTHPPLTILDALLTDGTVTSVRIVDGLVVSRGVAAEPDDVVVDGKGRLLLPAMAEAHAHLDKAFLAETIPNPRGDLLGAIIGMEEHRHLITRADTEQRAERAARLLLANGATAIRTHADVTTANGLTSVEALVAVRERLAHLMHIEIIALTGWPSIGVEGADQRALLRSAIAAGADGVGGCPHLETDSFAATDGFLELAGEAGVPIDLHTDEHTDPHRLTLEYLAERVVATGFTHPVTASHCVSLGMQPHDVQQRVAQKVAAAGISVVALPSSNLYLQGRDQQERMPRALTAVRALREAGVNVAAGADNLQDPFNLVGRGDCLETASLMVMAGHLLPEDAYRSVSNSTRHAMAMPLAGIDPGDTADLVLVEARSIREVVAFGSPGRTVIRSGHVVSTG
jgi:cytosine deaminase